MKERGACRDSCLARMRAAMSRSEVAERIEPLLLLRAGREREKVKTEELMEAEDVLEVSESDPFFLAQREIAFSTTEARAPRPKVLLDEDEDEAVSAWVEADRMEIGRRGGSLPL